MHLQISVFYVLLNVIFAAERNSLCVTPNGENGTCIPVNSCRPIKQAITYFNQDAINFAKSSQCGYDEGPLVCCGTVGQITSFAPTTTLPPVPTMPPLPAVPIENSLLPDRSLCGVHIAENRTIKSNITEMTEFPWLVALKYAADDGGPGGFLCSGTLINPRYVLTAAECLSFLGFNLTHARLGEWKFSTKECIIDSLHETICENPVLDVLITEKRSHPYFNKRSRNNNVALLRLEIEIKYNDYIRPICLPPNDYPPPPNKTQLETSGWSNLLNGAKSDVKLKSRISSVENEDCNKVYPNYLRAYPNKACAGGGGKRKNLCNGDSGSPIMRIYDKVYESEEDQWFQEGIVHKVSGCENKSYVGLYTRVSRYLHWILNNMRP